MDVEERVSLDSVSAEPLLVSEHVHRYELARELCAGRTVLDLCCGTGYGSRMLRETAAAVTGVDNDVATIDTAAISIGRQSDVRFEAADAIEYLGRDEAREFEVIVCFEGLEHLQELDRAIELLHELAANGTRMLLSVPNSRAFEEENRFHLTDFGYEEAMAAFARIGPATVIYQFLAEGSVMHRGEPGDLETSTVLPDHGEPEWANHFIGMINFEAADLPANLASHASIALAPNANLHMKSLERANRELWRVNARLARELMAGPQETSLAHGGTAAATIQLRLAEAEGALEEAERAREEADEEREQAHARVAELEHELAAQHAAHEAAPERAPIGTRFRGLARRLSRR